MRVVIDCNVWKTEKLHECRNMGKVKRLKLWWQLYVTWLPVRDLENFRAMDFCSIECTNWPNARPMTTVVSHHTERILGQLYCFLSSLYNRSGTNSNGITFPLLLFSFTVWKNCVSWSPGDQRSVVHRPLYNSSTVRGAVYFLVLIGHALHGCEGTATNVT